MYKVELTTEELSILIGLLGSLQFKLDAIEQGQKFAAIERKLKHLIQESQQQSLGATQ